MGRVPADMLRPYPSMLFGLETALLDLQNGGKGMLFDTPFTRGEEGITINGLVWMGSFDEMLERLEAKMRDGFRCVKLKIGAIDFNHELSLVRYIREAFTKDQIELRVDANGGFSPAQAPQRLEQLARYDIHSIEQPIRQHQWRDMAALCRETPIPIALDEEHGGIRAEHICGHTSHRLHHATQRTQGALIVGAGVATEVGERGTLSHSTHAGTLRIGDGEKP
jgi:L-alanine-DL-glutamate epimerase-like enolase superfamily enzyme